MKADQLIEAEVRRGLVDMERFITDDTHTALWAEMDRAHRAVRFNTFTGRASGARVCWICVADTTRRDEPWAQFVACDDCVALDRQAARVLGLERLLPTYFHDAKGTFGTVLDIPQEQATPAQERLGSWFTNPGPPLAWSRNLVTQTARAHELDRRVDLAFVDWQQAIGAGLQAKALRYGLLLDVRFGDLIDETPWIAEEEWLLSRTAGDSS